MGQWKFKVDVEPSELECSLTAPGFKVGDEGTITVSLENPSEAQMIRYLTVKVWDDFMTVLVEEEEIIIPAGQTLEKQYNYTPSTDELDIEVTTTA